MENYRGVADLEIELDQTTVLIGENNTGKTSVLEALHSCMTRSLGRRAFPFTEYDFHITSAMSDPSGAPPLVLTLTFEESKKDEWPDEIAQAFPSVMQTLDDDRQRITFRVSAKYEKTVKDFVVEWVFLDKDGNTLPTARQAKLVLDLQLLSPVFLLTAVRDSSQYFQPKSSFWAPFTKNPQITEEKRKEIEEQIEQINQSVLDSHKPFEVVKAQLAKTGNLVPLAAKDLVSVEAVPARIFDMLARTQVKLASTTGAKLPISQHGSGTQSLAVLFLFEAFLQSRLAEAYDKNSEPILALEEPESHLHPSAIRAMWKTLEKLSGQKIIATHSGDLLASVPIFAIRRLARRHGKIEVFRVKSATLSSSENLKVTYHIRSKRGSLLFARCWLLVEGQTDFTILPELARMARSDFESQGVACVEYAQCGLMPLIKVARDLGIEWHVLTDGDRAGKDYAGTATSLLGSDKPSDRITTLSEDDIEHCMWNGGYSSVYEGVVDTKHRSAIKSSKGSSQYVSETIDAAINSTSKPYLAHAVIAEIEKSKPLNIPKALQEVIERAAKLAASGS